MDVPASFPPSTIRGSLAESHASMVSHPDAVADFIVNAAESASSLAMTGARER
jgi:hypothetical protein